MWRVLSLVLAALLAVGVGTAIVTSIRDQVAAKGPPPLTLVRGVIGSEKEPFFRDPAVAAVFARHGLMIKFDIAGSRETATRVDLDSYDFAFPAGIPAAERIRRERKITAFYQPFYTPMAVGTFKPIARLLAKAGVASPLADGYWRLDMGRYLDLVGKKTRWHASSLQRVSTGRVPRSPCLSLGPVPTSLVLVVEVVLAGPTITPPPKPPPHRLDPVQHVRLLSHPTVPHARTTNKRSTKT